MDGEVDMAFIQTDKLTYTYEGNLVPAVKEVSLSFEKGSYTAIIGHNGSGKSTLAKLLCGIFTPTGGKVLVDGMDTADEDNQAPIREKCGMVFQNTDNQIVSSVVEEDVAFAPENLGVEPAQIRKAVDEALAAVGMTEYALHSTYKLSGGQKQRIAIAGILAMNPQCIVFDEATAMLDPAGRREISDTMRKLNDKGLTVITVTHHMNEAAMADRVVVISDGRLILDGTPKEVFCNVEKLRTVGLDVPQVTELLFELAEEGYNVPTDILNENTCADALCRIIKEKGDQA